MSAAYLCAAVVWIVPHFRGSAYPHLAFHFGDLGHRALSPKALAVNVSFLVTLLLPVAFLPVLHWRLALVAVPAIAESLLTTNWELHNIGFQYYVPALPILFISAIRGLSSRAKPMVRISTGESPQGDEQNNRPWLSGSMLLFSSLIGHVYLGIGPFSINPAAPASDHSLQASAPAVERIRALIPADAGVTASYRIAAHCLDADRLWTTANNGLGDYVVVHDADVIDVHLPRSAIASAIRTDSYQPLYADYHLVVLVRSDEPTPLAAELQSGSAGSEGAVVDEPIGEGIRLYAISAASEADGDYLRVRLAWVREPNSPRTQKDLRFGLVCGRLRWGPFFFARGAYPTNAWRAGVYYHDEIRIELPPGADCDQGSLDVALVK